MFSGIEQIWRNFSVFTHFECMKLSKILGPELVFSAVVYKEVFILDLAAG